jgi:FtsZ-binding cell division protein ZapB
MAEITIESLQNELKAAVEKNALLTQELTSSKEEVASLVKDLAASKKENADFEDVIKSLQSKISEQEALLPKVVTVTIDKKTYVVTGGVRTPERNVLTAEEVAADKDVCKWLLEMGSDILKLK